MKKLLFLACIISGCGGAQDDVDANLQAQSERIEVALQAIHQHQTKPSDMSEAFAIMDAKQKRLDEGLPVDDLNAQITAHANRLKAENDEAERLTEDLVDAMAGAYGYISALSAKCGGETQPVSAVFAKMNLDSLTAPDSESAESRFWALKWAYDEELNESNQSVDCAVIRPRIEHAMSLGNRLYEKLDPASQ